MTERTGKPTPNDIRETTKQFQNEEKGGADSNAQFSQAGHDTRNDAQDSGEDLPNRDRSTK